MGASMPKRVLLVDDSRVMRKMIKRVLELCCGEVHIVEAGDGAAALAEWRPEAFDLYLIDVNMPGVNGVLLLQALRERDGARRCPVIVVSTGVSDARLRQLEELGAVFVAKPFKPEDLARALAQCSGESHGP
jgi:CheY-like chemotaxis protein